MGQKVNPIGLRLGYTKGWSSYWFASQKKDYADQLIEDEKVIKYLTARIAKGHTSRILIERTYKRIIVNVHTARPGVIIGKGGGEIDKIKEEIKKIIHKEVEINIFEIKRPELDAVLVGHSIAHQLKARMSYKRVVKQAITVTMRMGAQGVKIQISGRLDGAEIARSEKYREGRVPLHTLRSDIDYAMVEASTIYGKIGIKIWIFKGEIYGKVDLSSQAKLMAKENSKAPHRDKERGKGKLYT